MRSLLRALAVPRATRAPMLGSGELAIAPSSRATAASICPELMWPTAMPMAAAVSVARGRAAGTTWLCWAAEPPGLGGGPFAVGCTEGPEQLAVSEHLALVTQQHLEDTKQHHWQGHALLLPMPQLPYFKPKTQRLNRPAGCCACKSEQALAKPTWVALGPWLLVVRLCCLAACTGQAVASRLVSGCR